MKDHEAWKKNHPDDASTSTSTSVLITVLVRNTVKQIHVYKKPSEDPSSKSFLFIV